MVDDVDNAVDFYTTHFGFTVRSNAAPAFADIVRGNLRLLLSGPTSSAGRPMPDGRTPEPGGWNRIHFIVEDIAAEAERLRGRGREVPQRHRQRAGRPADPGRGPGRQPHRDLPARGRLVARAASDESAPRAE
jgi:catechol 2,3-dioxygenase-like lactoylglutathione lyase family enzyme